MPEDYDDEAPPQRPRRRRPEPEYEDDEEEYREVRRRRRRRDEGDATGGLIPYKNPTALIGYYCGVFGLIPILGFILAPTACVLGILGLRYVNRHPTAKGTGHAVTALVLGGISFLAHYGICFFVVIAAIVGGAKK
jgi:hypothetical protein